MVSKNSEFLPFSSLAPELRNQIWREAVPDLTGLGLCPYRNGLWLPKFLEPSDEEYLPGHDNIDLDIRHDLLSVQIEVSLYSVNHEARGVALAWIREQNIEIRLRNHRPIFLRKFDISRDVLFIALDKMIDIELDPVNRMEQPDLEGRSVTTHPNIRHFAIPEAAFRSDDSLRHLMDWYCGLNVLFVLVGAQPDFEGQWELDTRRGKSFIWDHERGGFKWGPGECLGDEGLYKRIEEDQKGLDEEIRRLPMQSFEIRPIYAVRR
ncbi:hypothetical protein NM208_g2437 [Fusarium decemcellulare]|uniref:Uncharacterized protein n=2 Tax=Fusarium decemcellulare TaxID=57161 RepID=A0ACC1SKU6_9HYPO|nr:hypothetical protein NM208_g4431 [Fusarium decemcellulare]KAJ3545593.1 hypothetical protein NM208_g2437 [Fusarium decemcellulare]